MNPFFNWLKDTGTQTMLVLVGTVAACIAAFGTLYFGWKSLTKKDLKVLETEAAATSGHLQKQAQQEKAMVLASRVSMTVEGRGYVDEGLNAVIKVADITVKLTLIDLYSDDGQTSYGSASCVQEKPGAFVAAITKADIQKWYNSSPSASQVVRLKLRVHMLLLDVGEGAKNVPVTLNNTQVADTRKPDVPYGTVTTRVWEIHGEV